VTAIVGTIQDSAEQIGFETVDAVFCSNFLEHLDTKEAISDIFSVTKQLLRKGGRMLILQPNIKYTGGKYWDFFDHKTPLTEDALVECAAIHGFKTVKVIKKFLPYTTKSALPKAPWIISLYIKLMPFSGMIFGEQSFLVFEKPVSDIG
jgi:SAM-dependent methyltransferase